MFCVACYTVTLHQIQTSHLSKVWQRIGWALPQVWAGAPYLRIIPYLGGNMPAIMVYCITTTTPNTALYHHDDVQWKRTAEYHLCRNAELQTKLFDILIGCLKHLNQNYQTSCYRITELICLRHQYKFFTIHVSSKGVSGQQERKSGKWLVFRQP